MTHLLCLGRRGRVDPGRNWERRWDRHVVDESFRMRLVCITQDDRTSRIKLGFSSVMHRFGRHHPDAGVAMLAVVPRQQVVTDLAGVLDAGEAIRKLRAIRERFELRFGKRVVVGDVRTRVDFGDAQVSYREG